MRGVIGPVPRSARLAAGLIAVAMALLLPASRALAAGPLGSLSQLPSPNNCIGTTPECGTASTANLSGSQDIVVSPDGKNVYMVDRSANSVSEFARNADGSLTELAAPNDCIGTAAACVNATGIGSPEALA